MLHGYSCVEACVCLSVSGTQQIPPALAMEILWTWILKRGHSVLLPLPLLLLLLLLLLPLLSQDPDTLTG